VGLKKWIAFDKQAHSKFEFSKEELKKMIENFQHFTDVGK